MQLVAYGAQDIYLTGNPQITFFKVVYRRHTNFSMESIQQTFNGSADFGRKTTCTISRNGDLIHHVYLQVELPEIRASVLEQNITGTDVRFRWLNWIGHRLIKHVDLEIGGQRIDKHYGQWLHIWNELSQTAGHQVGYANMVGNVPRLTQVVSGQGYIPKTTLYVPLQFWFCRNPGLALPLIALQYHEVKINIEFNELKECCFCLKKSGGVDKIANSDLSSVTPNIKLGDKTNIYVDYIYLDTDERRRFAQVSHEYLIEQLQFTGTETITQGTTNTKVRMNFNHPVKELVWVVQPESHVDEESTKYAGGKQPFNFTDQIDRSYYSGVTGHPMGEGMVGPNDAPNNNLGLATTGGSWETAGTDFMGTTTENGWEDYLINNGITASGGGSTGLSGSWTSGSGGPFLFDRGCNPIDMAKIQLNGHDRFSEREGRYFNLVQPYQHHTNIPSCGINVYSFALKPEEHQPSGTCNMSRIDNAALIATLTNATTANGNAKASIYAVNYNVLRIMSGMGGLAYSN